MNILEKAIQNTLKPLTAKKMIIFGLGREGLSSYEFLRQYAPEEKLVLVDDLSPIELSPAWESVKDDNMASFTNPGEYQEYLTNEHLIFVTPGISPRHQFLQEALKVGAQLHSGCQLFFDVIASANALQKDSFKTIAITGTKGKSTTSSAIAHVLKKSGKRCDLGGNIGIPPLEMLNQKNFDIQDHQPTFFVLELSAHQLGQSVIRPHYSVLLNITPEHLDYYQDFTEYVAAKNKITFQQTLDDFLIFNPEYKVVRKIANKTDAQKIAFGGSTEDFPSPTAFIADGNLNLGEEVLTNVNELPVSGAHTIENLLPAVCIAWLLKIKPEMIGQHLKSFKPLAHRLETVHQTDQNILFVDDSLATTPEAVVMAIDSFAGRPIVLLAGGYERQQDFSQLAKKIIESDIETLLLFPTTGNRLAEEVKKINHNSKNINIIKVKSMPEAVSAAVKRAKPNSVVLLSPGSASFGMFKDYEDRSEQFTNEASEY
jgi:UDP-N-acetylmuramoylalanine--D-glutamate ligase